MKMTEMYPEGTRIRLIRMPDDPRPIPPGTKGTVTSAYDGLGGGLNILWDNGRMLGLVNGVDEWEIIDE